MRWQVAPAEHYPWIAERAGIVAGPQFRAIEALDGKDEIRGMVGYDGWTPNLVCMHLALDSPMAARCLIQPAFGIAFTSRRVAIGQVIASNEAALRLDRHLGFREVARIRDAWQDGVDIVVLEMRREECRWIPAELRERKAA